MLVNIFSGMSIEDRCIFALLKIFLHAGGAFDEKNFMRVSVWPCSSTAEKYREYWGAKNSHSKAMFLEQRDRRELWASFHAAQSTIVLKL